MTASCSRTYESCLERGTEHWHRPQRPACLPAPDRQGTRQIQTSALETTVYNVASRSARTLGSSGPPGASVSVSISSSFSLVQHASNNRCKLPSRICAPRAPLHRIANGPFPAPPPVQPQDGARAHETKALFLVCRATRMQGPFHSSRGGCVGPWPCPVLCRPSSHGTRRPWPTIHAALAKRKTSKGARGQGRPWCQAQNFMLCCWRAPPWHPPLGPGRVEIFGHRPESAQTESPSQSVGRCHRRGWASDSPPRTHAKSQESQGIP